MTPATPVSRRRRRRVQVVDAAGHQDLRIVRPNELAGAGRGPASAPPWLRTKRATPAPTSSPTSAVDGRRRRPTPGEGRQPLRARIEPDRQPVAGDRQAGAEVVGPIGDRRGQHDPGRAGREGEPDRVGRVHARRRPGAGPRSARRSRRPSSRLAGRPGPRAVEVDEVDEPRARAPRTARRSGPGGRSARRSRRRRRASRRPASGRASRSMAGMTCTGRVRPRPSAAVGGS